MSTYKCEFLLIQQSPIIHFQHNQIGAALRASEVKPKLDRYLIKELGEDYCGKWFVGDGSHPALDYKMRFFADGRQESIITPDIYYGNMGSNTNKVCCIYGNCKMEIMCFHTELMKEIIKHIQKFFIVTNFGRMQGKGFGSYIVERTDISNPEAISKILAINAGANACYYFGEYDSLSPDGNSYKFIQKNDKGFDINTTPQFKDIKKLYTVMKSGVNLGSSYQKSFLFKYFLEKGIGNEKAYIKRKKITPWIKDEDGEVPYYTKEKHRGKDVGGNMHDEDFRYVRALLGVGETLSYQSDEGRKAITIKSTENKSTEKIQRYASPVMFKIIGKYVYFVANREDPYIYDKKFKFENQSKNSESLTTPTSSEFDIDDFMSYFVRSYNTEIIKGRFEEFEDYKKRTSAYKIRPKNGIQTYQIGGSKK